MLGFRPVAESISRITGRDATFLVLHNLPASIINGCVIQLPMKILSAVYLLFPCLVLPHQQDSTAEQAIDLIQSGRAKAASELLLRVVARDPHHASYWNLLGIAESETGDAKSAKKAFMRGLALAPQSPELNENAGLLFYRQADYTSAKHYLSQATRLGSAKPGVLFSLAAATLTTLLAGLAPALHASRKELVEPLKDSGKGVNSGFRRGGVRKALVVCEIALSMILLAGAGLLMRTMVALMTVDLGLNPQNVLVIRLPLPKDRYKTAAQVQQFYSQLLPRLSALPGVVAATETSTLPPYGGSGSEADVPGKTHAEKWRAIYQLCSEGYFPTVGLKLMSGRVFTRQEVADKRHVAVINHTLAKKFFGDENPVGRQLVLKDLLKAPDPVTDPTFTIVGVISDAKNQGLQEPISPEALVPYSITGSYERGILVRTRVAPMSLERVVRREIWAVDRGVALTLTGTLEGYLKSFSYSGPQFALTILGIFAVTGLILVAIGTYSVLAYTVSQQTHEIGIRMALGALEQNVFRMVLQMGGILVCAGLAAGVIASLLLNRLIANQLWGVQPHDPATIVTAVVIIAAVSAVACLIPAKRATRVDPLVALRYE